jgi:branched-chain amino acid transport system substrate-binding protein
MALEAAKTSSWLPARPKGYIARWVPLMSEPLSSFGGHAWDALHLVASALKAVGCDRAKIRDYLENNTSGFVGQHGVFKYSPNDHIGLDKDAFLMVVVKNGDWALAK